MHKNFITLFAFVCILVFSTNAQTASKPKTTDNDKKTDKKGTLSKTPQEGLKWYGWNEGYELAVKKKKILIIDIYTDWCGWCKKMDRDTYSKQAIIDMLNKDFVAVKFNPEVPFNEYMIEGMKYNNKQLYSMLVNNQPTGYPTTVFIYTDTKKIDLFSGYQDEANFKISLEKYIAQKGK